MSEGQGLERRGMMSMDSISQWEFDIHALSLPRGHAFGDRTPVAAWRSGDGLSCGVVRQDVTDGTFGFLVMRRRVDRVWTVIERRHGFAFRADAQRQMAKRLRDGEPLEPLPPGTAARPALYDLKGRTPSEVFSLLRSASHAPAAWTLDQLYLAMPRPDRNWGGRLPDGELPHAAVGGTVVGVVPRAGTIGDAATRITRFSH